ncbi:MAG TPA: hypothetical protein VH092_17100 [Urbifossiella sp.]|nr:hypothetical protein [Urbifossiella sp.]
MLSLVALLVGAGSPAPPPVEPRYEVVRARGAHVWTADATGLGHARVGTFPALEGGVLT